MRKAYLYCFIGVALALVTVGRVVVKAAPESLVWDAMEKRYTNKPGEDAVAVSFTVTNTSQSEIVITNVSPSCQCTIVKLPARPWRLAPGASGTIEASVDMTSKQGSEVIKTITVDSSAGTQQLVIRIAIPPDARPGNMMIAQKDRQSVFRHDVKVANGEVTDCAKCHAPPEAVGKMGAELFALVCSNCHESKNRNEKVPDLASFTIPTTRDFWRNAVTKGKEGTMMPAFAKADGGPLDDAQLQSLVDYLSRRYPPKLQIDFGLGPLGPLVTPVVK